LRLRPQRGGTDPRRGRVRGRGGDRECMARRQIDAARAARPADPRSMSRRLDGGSQGAEAPASPAPERGCRQLNDPELVRAQYADEVNLAARKAIYANADGPDAREILFQAIAELEPRRVLEVGGGEGELAERIVRELGVELAFVDQSERMVEIARGRGLDAQVGDVQALPFADAGFDCAVAAWMLYHVQDLEQALTALTRVLEPGARPVAV